MQTRYEHIYFIENHFNQFHYVNGIPPFFRHTFLKHGFIPISVNDLTLVTERDLLIFIYPDRIDWKGTRIAIASHLKTNNINSLIIILDLLCFYQHTISPTDEVTFFNHFSYIIGQSEKMNDYLKQIGVTTPLINLELFDYPLNLNEDEIHSEVIKCRTAGRETRERKQLVYAGKIDNPLRNWIFSETLKNLSINVYAQMTPKEEQILTTRNQFGNIHYKGVFTASDFFSKIEGDYALIWNGTDDGEEMPVFGALMFEFKKLSISSKLDFAIARGLQSFAKKGQLIAIWWKNTALVLQSIILKN